MPLKYDKILGKLRERDSFEELVEFIATEDILAYQVVTGDGKVANSSTSSHRGKIIGIAAIGVLNGFVGEAIVSGEITNAGWAWTIGSPLYLNGNVISATAPTTGFSQQIAVATKTDTIDIDLKPSILL